MEFAKKFVRFSIWMLALAIVLVIAYPFVDDQYSFVDMWQPVVVVAKMVWSAHIVPLTLIAAIALVLVSLVWYRIAMVVDWNSRRLDAKAKQRLSGRGMVVMPAAQYEHLTAALAQRSHQ